MKWESSFLKVSCLAICLPCSSEVVVKCMCILGCTCVYCHFWRQFFDGHNPWLVSREADLLTCLFSVDNFLTHTTGGFMLGFWTRMRCFYDMGTECNRSFPIQIMIQILKTMTLPLWSWRHRWVLLVCILLLLRQKSDSYKHIFWNFWSS